MWYESIHEVQPSSSEQHLFLIEACTEPDSDLVDCEMAAETKELYSKLSFLHE